MYTVYMIFAIILVLSFITGCIVLLVERKLTKKDSLVNEVKAPTTIISLKLIKKREREKYGKVEESIPVVSTIAAPTSEAIITPIVSPVITSVVEPVSTNIEEIGTEKFEVPADDITQKTIIEQNNLDEDLDFTFYEQPKLIVPDIDDGFLENKNPNIIMDEEII